VGVSHDGDGYVMAAVAIVGRRYGDGEERQLSENPDNYDEPLLQALTRDLGGKRSQEFIVGYCSVHNTHPGLFRCCTAVDGLLRPETDESSTLCSQDHIE
jgi:hypothetical protein